LTPVIAEAGEVLGGVRLGSPSRSRSCYARMKWFS